MRILTALLLTSALHAQLIPTGTPLPRREKPPVVFLNGYQSNCPSGGFSGTFGNAATLLQATGRASVFFDNCTANRVVIEELGRALGTFLNALRYEDGQPVNQVDVVVHSMGGLILRSYLSGKQTADDTFSPPAETRIRKIVFLATPHFGTSVASSFGNDVQTAQLSPGSRFVYDLATWNQGLDDLRGIEALSIIGDSGSGFAAGPAQFSDGVVTLTSGSLLFMGSGNTRIVRACHTAFPLICLTNSPNIANVTDTNHVTYPILLSFLDGTDAWKTAGQSPGDNSFLNTRSGLLVGWKNATDQAQAITAATATPQAGTAATLATRTGIAYLENAPSGNLQLSLNNGALSRTFDAPAGATRVANIKQGPFIGAVIPAAGLVTPRTVAPGTFISIYGSDLGTGTNVAGEPYPRKLGDTEIFVGTTAIPLQVATPGQVNGVLPDGLTGLVKLRVKTTQGEHTVNVLLEPAVPAVFVREGIGAALNAGNAIVTRGNQIRKGEIIQIYLTGLGATTLRDGLQWANVQPTVTIGGKACTLQYAGRTPQFAGVDQINCRLADDTPSGPEVPLVVTSSGRSSPAVPIPVL